LDIDNRVNEKATKPLRVLRAKEKQYADIQDCFVFYKEDSNEYCLYTVAKEGVYFFKNIERKEEGMPVTEDRKIHIDRNCADCTPNGLLCIDIGQSKISFKEAGVSDTLEHCFYKYYLRASQA